MRDDPNSLAGLIRQLGGKPIDHPNFRFDVPLSEKRTVMTKLQQVLGDDIDCRDIAERRERHPTRNEIHGVVTVELFRSPPRTESNADPLMSVALGYHPRRSR
jgi:hypothetical protein